MSMAMRRISGGRLFLAFMAFGALVGLLLGAFTSTSAMANANSNGQHNVLAVLVRDLGERPSPLLGAWLAAYSPAGVEVSWAPLYPTPLGISDEFAEAHDAYWVAGDDLASLEGLTPLRSAGAWWDEVAILDQAGLAALLAEVDPDFEITAIDTWAEPQRALRQQVSVLQAFCAEADTLRQSQAFLDTALGLIPSHARASLSAFDMIALWDYFNNQGISPSCNHPWAN